MTRCKPALVVVLAAGGLASCASNTTTVTQPASTAPLGRPIGGVDRRPPSLTDMQARDAARRFLVSYLAISYGRAQPEKLRGATPALRNALIAQQARVPEGVRGRRPRIVNLRLQAVGDGRARAMASVDDGDIAPYPLSVTLARSGAGWVAVSVGG